MVKKIIGLASILLVLAFLGAACAPAASQQELQELRYQVQSLSLSLATTQENLAATQENLATTQQALQNLQSQNQQLQNQVNETSSTCTTCDKTAQTCVINPYGCVTTTTAYCSNPCYYTPPCTPIRYSPYNPCYYFFPYPYRTIRYPWVNHPYTPPAQSHTHRHFHSHLHHVRFPLPR